MDSEGEEAQEALRRAQGEQAVRDELGDVGLEGLNSMLAGLSVNRGSPAQQHQPRSSLEDAAAPPPLPMRISEDLSSLLAGLRVRESVVEGSRGRSSAGSPEAPAAGPREALECLSKSKSLQEVRSPRPSTAGISPRGQPGGERQGKAAGDAAAGVEEGEASPLRTTWGSC